ncbi:MAG TPA: hypothetical protein VGM88_32770 [Kofleriaceae bacterium]
MRHVLVLALVLAACKGSDKAAPAPAASQPPPAQPALGQTQGTAAKAMSPSQDVTGLVARLRFEAAHRPTATLPVEKVIDALDKAGLPLQKQRQYAGFTVKALYCAGGTTTSGVPVSICEYKDDAAAAAGKVYLDKELALGGTRAVKGLTLINAGVGPNPDVDKAVAVFNAL